MSKTKLSEKKLQKLMELQKKQFKEVQKAFVVRESAELVKNIVNKTPVDTGRLRAAWHEKPIEKEGNSFIVSCSNNVEYAEFVEYGHRYVIGGGRFKKLEDFDPETDTAGFVAGKFMARDGLKETQEGSQKRWDEHFNKWKAKFDKVMK